MGDWLWFWSLLLLWKRLWKKCCSITCINFRIAALQKHQASFTAALSRWHFASSGGVDQSCNSGSYKYKFGWLQNCWTGRHLFSLVWPSHRRMGGNSLNIFTGPSQSPRGGRAGVAGRGLGCSMGWCQWKSFVESGAVLPWVSSFGLQVTKIPGIFFLEKRSRTCDSSAFWQKRLLEFFGQ